jgi:energy-coupling factor transporter ATP-binding protein EcfA2
MRIEAMKAGKNFLVPWDRATCRVIINRLKDGQPPPFEAIELMSIGQRDHINLAKKGLEIACNGGYEIMILEGSYGIGKTHLLNLISVIATHRNFKVKHVEVGSGRVYLNNPRQLFQQILGGDKGPTNSEYKRYTPYNNDHIRRFVAGLALLAYRHHRRGSAGLVVLIDELENTFSSLNLPNYRSRANAYRLLDALFRGGIDSSESWARIIRLSYLYIALAITPGTLEAALNDGPMWGYYYGGYRSPAEDWELPTRKEITPLNKEQALVLVQRIRGVHRVAFEWPADQFVTDEILEKLCQEWLKLGSSRDERSLVKGIIQLLEVTEQNV